jgi:UDP-N-acetylglucosamine 4-epimerase
VPPPIHEGFRVGDIRHSQADIAKARRLLGYDPVHDVRGGLREALPWYEARLATSSPKVANARGTS